MHLRDGTVHDISSVTDIGMLAMWDDEIVQFLAPYRDQYPVSHRQNQLHRTKKRFYSGNRLIVAVTDDSDCDWTGQEIITGFAFWSDTKGYSTPENLPTSCLGNAFEQRMLSFEAWYRWYFGLDKSFDKSRYAVFWQILAQNPIFEDIPEHWELEVLAIAPQYQRRGVGTMLLNWGVEQASKHGMPVIVAATCNGEQLYRKHGFKDCGRIEFDDCNSVWKALVWYP